MDILNGKMLEQDN